MTRSAIVDIRLNMRVKIVSGNKYGTKYVGKIGVIENTSCGGTAFGVKFKECENPRSSKGLFWFAEDEIEFIESEEIGMLNINENFKVAGVKFLEGTNTDKEYYYALFDDDIQVDDLVVVQTGHHGLALAKVASISTDGKNKVQCNREIISKVDTTAFDARMAQRKALIEIKKEMDKRVAELQETALYELLAEKDPALATMLGEYKKLTGGT